MKKLILIRHAKSDWYSTSATDFDRPLNNRGKKAALLMGQRLAIRGCCPDGCISSPAKRARQTAKKIAGQLDFLETEIEYNQAIYEARQQTLIDIVRQLDNRHDEVILIGHNPGFSSLGQWFSPDSPDWLPTCGLLEMELAIDSWAQIEEDCATALRYDYPKNPE